MNRKYSTLAIAVLAVAGLMMGGCAKKTATNADMKNGGGSIHGNTNKGGNAGAMGGIPADRSVYFAFDSAKITPAAERILAANAAWLKSHPQRTATVEGNCDERGSREYNLALGQRRADAVKAWLVNHGVAAASIGTASFGEENPVCRGTGESCWSRNRRADIVIR